MDCFKIGITPQEDTPDRYLPKDLRADTEEKILIKEMVKEKGVTKTLWESYTDPYKLISELSELKSQKHSQKD